jgi:hypothetical protein
VVDELRIFPTTFRGKHPKLVSYPIGAEALSLALADVPQAEQLTCSFYAGSPHSGSHIREIENVLWVGYRRMPVSFFDSAERAKQRGNVDWTINVYAVEASQRSAIKQALIRHTLPDVVRPWLLQHVPSGHAVGGEGLWLTYDIAAKKLLYEERATLEPEQV